MSFTTASFNISISQDRVDELKALVSAARLPAPFYEGTQDQFGVTSEWMKTAVAEWKTGYDWRAYEAELNKFNHFIANVPFEGSTSKVHYIHHKATSGTGASIPLLLLHGWPGSFLEFLPSIEPLAKAGFDVVVASLPGFTFGDRLPADRNFKTADAAKLVHDLMLGLGYNEYTAQGGDLGSLVASILAVEYPKHCKAIHLNCMMVQPPADFDYSIVPEDEAAAFKLSSTWFQREGAYANEHGTKPGTIAHVLHSSPVAQLAWIGEKFLSWSNITPPLKTILDSISLWWLTDTFPTSIYCYRELGTLAPRYIQVPFGFTWNKNEVITPPLALVKHNGNLQWSRKHSVGGHFFALERPEAFVEDVKDCFRVLWPVKDQVELKEPWVA